VFSVSRSQLLLARRRIVYRKAFVSTDLDRPASLSAHVRHPRRPAPRRRYQIAGLARRIVVAKVRSLPQASASA
jgi:hypothetical protein